MSQRYNDNTKKPKPKENQLASKFGRGPQVQERVLLVLLSIYENTSEKLLHPSPKICYNFTYLVVDGRVQLEHHSHIVKVIVKATS